jgi:ketosteroid isomerase-like protein
MTDPGFATYTSSLETLFRDGDPRCEQKAEELANIRLIQDAVLAIGRNDMEALEEVLADDVRLDIRAPENLSFVSQAAGREQVLEAVKRNFGEVQNQRPAIEAVVAQGDTVVVMSREEGEVKGTGEPYRIDCVQRFVCRDGKIALIHELAAPAGGAADSE